MGNFYKSYRNFYKILRKKLGKFYQKPVFCFCLTPRSFLLLKVAFFAPSILYKTSSSKFTHSDPLITFERTNYIFAFELMLEIGSLTQKPFVTSQENHSFAILAKEKLLPPSLSFLNRLP